MTSRQYNAIYELNALRHVRPPFEIMMMKPGWPKVCKEFSQLELVINIALLN
jgi:hypothetical protein